MVWIAFFSSVRTNYAISSGNLRQLVGKKNGPNGTGRHRLGVVVVFVGLSLVISFISVSRSRSQSGEALWRRGRSFHPCL
jgi:hypothetical protein